MIIQYRKRVCQEIVEAVAQAKRDNKEIDHIDLNPDEAGRFRAEIAMFSYPFGKEVDGLRFYSVKYAGVDVRWPT